ncbi:MULTISPECIES: MFS transporter [Pseudomonas]|uniref:MFS transporter n=1 Tax=Pseudomonas TaxID=286 RepID=UPI000D8AB48E|nr:MULTISPECIES: MFS transporter [Pseudomonas]MBH3384621.1 MFS transporter [Pseudomonas juntendi]MBR7521486.1 MFS transporter [Pseudomonas juntendi]PYB96713.1 MFS transporter [Pseudomonas sp. MB-090624]WBM31630.1 MFS transporter [Pseudomonas sp. NY11382]
MSTDRQAGLAQSALLLFGSCLPVLGAVLIAPILPRMQEHFADTPSVAILTPIALTIPALVIALLAPFAGMIADRLGRKPLLLGSLMLYTLCGLLPLWLESLPAIVASRAGLGLAEAGIMTCCTALMGDYYQGSRRERLFALQMVATSLSAAVFIALGGALGQNDWRLPFMLYAAGVLLLPIMARCLWEPSPLEASSHQAAPERFPWNALLPLYALTILAGISLFIVPVQAGYLLTLLQVDAPQQIGMTMGANQLGVLIGALLFRLLTGLRRQTVMLLAFATAGLGGLLMAKAGSHGWVIVAVLVNGLGVGLMLPALITWVMSKVSFAQRGRAAGGFTAALFAGEFLSPLVVIAFTGGQLAALPTVLVWIAIMQFVLALVCLVLHRVFRALAESAAALA